MFKRVGKHLKNIYNKPEEDRIKIMWVLVIFCMIVILGGWFVIYKFNNRENKIANEISRMPSFSDLQKNVGDVNKQKENLFEEILDIAKKAEIEKIVIDYIKENELLCENDMMSCRLHLKEKDVSNLKLENIEKLENNWHLEYRQYYKNILVNDSDISFMIDDAEKKVISHISNFDPDIKLSNVEPKITKEEAYKIAKEDLNKSLDNGDNNFDLKKSELTIYRNMDENPVEYYLTWKLNIFSLQPLCDYYYFIDAENGKVVFSFDDEKN